MAIRQRSKPTNYTVIENGNSRVIEYGSSEYMSDDPSPVKGKYVRKNVTHAKCTQPFYGKSSSGATYIGYQDCSHAHDIAFQIWSAKRSEVYYPLDFQQDDDFELFTALADADATIAQFGRKAIASLFKPKRLQDVANSSAAVQWGILPFVSDVKSLYNSLNSLYSDDFSRQMEMANGKRVRRRFSADSEKEGSWKFKGKSTLTGILNINPSTLPTSQGGSDAFAPLKIALDELGVHPDLKTLWDVVPLSFAIDYVLPIGDTLERLKPRGWFKPTFNFSGSFSIQGELTIYWEFNPSKVHVYDVYCRGSAPVSMSSRRLQSSTSLPESPSFSDTLNLGILHAQRSR